MRFRPVTLVTILLIVCPFLAVFLLFGQYRAAAGIGVAGAVAAFLAGSRRSTSRGRTLLFFSLAGGLLILFIILPILNLVITTDLSKILATARDSGIQSAIAVTLSSALIATLISIAFGVPLGYALAREDFAGKAVVEGIVDMPVVIPHTIAGIALLFIFGRAGPVGAPLNTHFGIQFTNSFWGIVIAMLFVGVPFSVNYARDGFLKVDPRMEYVARSLGASSLDAFFRVTIPLTWRALLSGAILTWARAVSEYVAISVIAYYPKTINTYLYEWYNYFGYSYTKPLAALLVIVVMTIFVGLRMLAGTRRSGA